MAFPAIPPRLKEVIDQALYKWCVDIKDFVDRRLGNMEGDITVATSGKGLVLTNVAGTITKRVRLNDAGNDIVIEDV
jgi:hypothetical protein